MIMRDIEKEGREGEGWQPMRRSIFDKKQFLWPKVLQAETS